MTTLVCQSNQYLCLNCWKSKWFHWSQRILNPSSPLQNSLCPFVQHVQKSKNTPKGARSGFYQKGWCLFQFGVENFSADVFEELGLKLEAVSSSSHLLIFLTELFEVCACIIHDASLCLVTMNANGLLVAVYPLRRIAPKWRAHLNCNNSPFWRILSGRSGGSFRIHKLKHLQHLHRFSWQWHFGEVQS